MALVWPVSRLWRSFPSIVAIILPKLLFWPQPFAHPLPCSLTIPTCIGLMPPLMGQFSTRLCVCFARRCCAHHLALCHPLAKCNLTWTSILHWVIQGLWQMLHPLRSTSTVPRVLHPMYVGTLGRLHLPTWQMQLHLFATTLLSLLPCFIGGMWWMEYLDTLQWSFNHSLPSSLRWLLRMWLFYLPVTTLPLFPR